MKKWLLLAGRILVTLIVVVVALIAARWMWVHYEVEPWTRDGRVRADVAEVAPDVAGFVTEVNVIDNQLVHRGQVLFVLDQPRYRVALAQAQATVLNDRAVLAEAQREVARNNALGDLVAQELREQSMARAQEAQAALNQAQAGVDAAKLNLDRTVVRASVNGVVSNLELRPGDYLAVGHQAFALIDTDTLHVDGYFEETKLPRIRVGDAASVKIMGEALVLHGHVVSIAAGIEDRERSPSGNLLANVNPTFSWVRLAQRVPVRIVLDAVPAYVRLIAGRTATVTILTPHVPRTASPWWDFNR
jgi:multidrug resistance efflux pump